MTLVFLFSSVCKKINSSAMVVIKTLTSPATPLRRLSALFLLCLGLLSPSLVYAATFANHAVGSATAGATKWATAVSGSSCATASCHGAVVPGASPTTNGTFGYSSGAFLTYANSPDDLAGAAAAIGGAGGMPAANIANASAERNDLSAYLASFVTPELTAIADFTLAPGAAYPATASRQISPQSGQDYIVNTTTFSAQFPAGLTGLAIGSSTGVVTGNVPNNLTTPQTFAVTLRAINSAASPTTGTVSFNLTVQAVQNIVFNAAPIVTVGGTGTVTLASMGGSGQPVLFTSNNTSACTVDMNTGEVTGVSNSAGNCSITATQAASGNFIASNVAPSNSPPLVFAIGAGVQSINFAAAPAIIFGGTGVVSATGGGSGKPVTFSIDPISSGICTATGANGSLITSVGVGLCRVRADQAAGGAFDAATTVTQDINIGMASQAISFGAAPTILEGGAGTVTATGGASGNPVLFGTSTPAVCSVSGNVVTALTVGTCNVTASQAGNTNFAAAPAPTPLSIVIGSAPPVASAASFDVNLNTPTTLDLSPFTTGSSIIGVNITSAPTKGAVTVNGMKVTYIPVNDYFGKDTFTYVAFGTLGASSPATVTITIVGRPDPRQNANVMTTLKSQTDAAKRFSRTQVSNFQQRAEFLHARTNQSSGGAAIADFNKPLTPAMSSAAKIAAIGQQLSESSQQSNELKAAAPVMLAYQDAPASAQNSAGATDQKLAALGNTLVSILSTKSINLAGLTSAVGDGAVSNELNPIEIWIMGNISFGARDTGGGAALSSFRTNGVTIGADKRFSDSLVVGAGVGYARERTDIGDDGSKSLAKGVSAAVYASYMPTDKVFIDALLGYGSMDFDGDRFVAPANDFARLNRSGSQVFGLLTAGYEYRKDGLLFSPYTRLNMEYNRLDAATETGAGLNALNFSEQTTHTGQLSLGLRAEATNQIDGGLSTPHARIELQGNFDRNGSSSIQYADQLNGAGFNLSSSNNSSRGILLGIGNDFILNNGLKLAFEYQTLRGEGNDNSQSINFRLSKELGGGAYQQQLIDSAEIASTRLGVRVDAGYTYDDNLTRAENSIDKQKDSSFNIRVSKGGNIKLTEHARIVLNGFVAGERFNTYRGLENVSTGLQGELQYRSSGEFTAPTFGVFAKTSYEEFESKLRDGVRYSAGISLRKPWTDRITLFTALGYNVRNSKSVVFDTKDTSARFNIDYMLTKKSAIYFSGEYRQGDTLSSGTPSLKNADLALSGALEADDVFTNPQLTNYRFKGHSYLTTLGYNLPLGAKDSLDFSWRRIQSSPDDDPSYITDSTKYIVNQYSIVYLVRF